MLEVDGRVASPDDLVRRVKAVLARAGQTDRTFGGIVPPAPDVTPPSGPTTARAAAIKDRADAVQPPPLLATTSPLGRAKRFGKRAVRKLTYWYVEPRWVPQREFDVETAAFAVEINETIDRLGQSIAETRNYTRRVADRTRVLAFDAGDLGTAVSSIEHALGDINRALADVDAKMDQLRDVFATRTDVGLLHDEVRVVLARLGAASAAGGDVDYVAFEDRFRGESSALKESQRQYLDWIPPVERQGLVVDIGCGRGETLESLVDAGHQALGVDPDPGMVEVCRQKGLDVVEADALTWLAEQDDESTKAIVCVQVVEHLFTSELVAFVRSAHRVLQPGGVLLMETINPRSWHAFGNHFLADTSHVRAVHPETLRFICEQAGFAQADLVERSRHPLDGAADNVEPGPTKEALTALLHSVYGFQDYSIIATK